MPRRRHAAVARGERDRSRRPLSHPLRSALERRPGARARLHDRRRAEEEARRPGRGGARAGRVLSGAPRRANQTPPDDPVARLTDAYFNKTKEIVRRHGDKRVTYAVFMRRPVITTPRLMVDFLEATARARGTKFDIELPYKEGEWVGAGEVLAYISGSLAHLVDLETLYLQ